MTPAQLTQLAIREHHEREVAGLPYPQRVWKVCTVMLGSKPIAYQAATYSRTTDKRGLPVWRKDETLGPRWPFSNDGYARGLAADNATKEGRASGLFRDETVRSGGLALDIDELLGPELSAVYRLGGIKLAFFCVASGKRWVIALGQTPRNARRPPVTKKGRQPKRVPSGYTLVRRLPSVSGRQLSDLRKLSGIPRLDCANIPHEVGKPIMIWNPNYTGLRGVVP